jgi:ferredoxin--NADP+ reductase
MATNLEYNSVISQRMEIAPGLVILRIVPDNGLFEFKPGQYTILGLKQRAPRVAGADPDTEVDKARGPDWMVRRAYSIASSSVERQFVEVYVTLVRSGELTPRLFQLKIGDRLYLGRKATGLFTLDKVAEGKHVLLIATGTGLAPYMSMIRTYLEGTTHRFVILHGARYSWDLGYRDELMTLARFSSNVEYLPAVSRPQQDPTWSGLTGRIQAVIESGAIEAHTGLKLAPELFDVFLCGNPGMIAAVAEILEEKGFQRDAKRVTGTIHVEEYW